MRDNVMAGINARSLKEEKQPILGLALIKSPHPTIDHDKVQAMCPGSLQAVCGANAQHARSLKRGIAVRQASPTLLTG